MRILNGEEVGNIPFIDKSPSQYAFNYLQLKKWGIKLSKLPEQSKIIGQPDSIYKKYKSKIEVKERNAAGIGFEDMQISELNA